ncbi:MAG: nuclear transport factor 2 family protein [Pseudomonadota bacterium]
MAVSVMLAGCAVDDPNRADESVQEANTEKAIAAIESYHSEWEALDFDRVTQWHAPDFEYVFFDQIVPGEAFPAVLSDKWMTGVTRYRIDESDYRPVVISSDAVWVTLNVADNTQYADGSAAETSGVMSYLLVRSSEEWKVRRVHHSGPPPADLYEGES